MQTKATHRKSSCTFVVASPCFSLDESVFDRKRSLEVVSSADIAFQSLDGPPISKSLGTLLRSLEHGAIREAGKTIDGDLDDYGCDNLPNYDSIFNTTLDLALGPLDGINTMNKGRIALLHVEEMRKQIQRTREVLTQYENDMNGRKDDIQKKMKTIEARQKKQRAAKKAAKQEKDAKPKS
jgi:hypothetical protein